MNVTLHANSQEVSGMAAPYKGNKVGTVTFYSISMIRASVMTQVPIQYNC